MTDLSDRLRPVLSRMCNRQTMDRFIEPVLADIKLEHDEAMRLGRVWRGRWVRLAGYVALVKVLAWHGISVLLDWTPDDLQALFRTVAVAALITGVLTLLLAVPVLANSPARSGVPYLAPFMYLIPQGLPLAIPMGLVLGIICGTAARAQPGRSLNVIVLLTIVGTTAAFLDLAWLVPGANQAYRLSTWGPDALRGANELTFGELRALLWGVGSQELNGTLVAHLDRQALMFLYYTRWALSCATLVFALFAFSMPQGRLLRASAASAGFLGYYELMYGGRQLVFDGMLPAYAAAWLPNVALLALAIASLVYRFRQTARSHAL